MMGLCLIWQPAIVFNCNISYCYFVWRITLSLSLSLSIRFSLLLISVIHGHVCDVLLHEAEALSVPGRQIANLFTLNCSKVDY